MEWRLEYDSEKLRTLGISPYDIQAAIQQAYRKEFLGTHNVDNGRGGKQWIRLALVPEKTDFGFDPTTITVTASNGRLFRLDQLVSVVHTDVRHSRGNGQPAGTEQTGGTGNGKHTAGIARRI